jgi:TolB-like protein
LPLTAFRNDILEPDVSAKGGTIVKRMGDGWFMEFTNASDAIEFAIQVQNTLANGGLIQIRIGVHIGDVTIQEDDLYGGGINIAARLEALAESGQVLISDTVYSSLDGVTAGYFTGGEAHQLKNIERPVHVWRWTPKPETTISQPDQASPSTEVEKPSVAVLPFSNLSSDAEQEFFADGIVEDLIMALSRFAWLVVIARNSCFTYKGKSVPTSQVAEELGVRYIVQGSVRSSPTRIRVSVQLIDANLDRTVWSENYDRPTGDLFDIQDEISQAITGVLVPALSNAERDRCVRSTRPSLDAWEAYQKALAHYYRPFSPEDHAETRRLLDQSIELDPRFSDALAMIGLMAVYAINSGLSSYTATREEIIAEGRLSAMRAVQADDNNALAHVALGRIQYLTGEADASIAECRTAVSLNPNLAMAHNELGFVLGNSGYLDEAISHLNTAINLSPNDPSRWNFHLFKGSTLLAAKDYVNAIASMREAARLRSTAFWPYVFMIVCFCELEQMDKASEAAKDLLDRNPNWTTKKTIAALTNSSGISDQCISGLRKVGFPEG